MLFDFYFIADIYFRFNIFSYAIKYLLMFPAGVIVLLFECFATQSYNVKTPLRIIAGTSAKPGEYPYIVSVETQIKLHYDNGTTGIEYISICTGTAIAANWVLTAGHCVYDLDDGYILEKEKSVIRYGQATHKPWIYNLFSDVLSIVLHASYTILDDDTLKNDIALIKTKPIKIAQYGKLSAVDYSSTIGHEAVTAGFGITNQTRFENGNITTHEFDSAHNLKKPLQVLKVLVVKCKDNVKVYPKICIVNSCGSPAATCPGDSGSPVIHPSGVIGIISQGEQEDCEITKGEWRKNFDTYVTATSPYIDWVSHVIGKDNKT